MDTKLNSEQQQLVALTATILKEAEHYKVATAEQYSLSADMLKRIKGHQKKLDDEEKTITKPLNDALKATRDLFRSPKADAEKAESLVKRALLAYADEQDRIRREEQRKADEQARKEREKLEEQARKAAASGKEEKADLYSQRAAAVVPAVIQRAPPVISGLSTRETWHFEVTNEMEVPRQYLSVDDKKIRAVVNALKKDANIPGVRVWSDKGLASGSR